MSWPISTPTLNVNNASGNITARQADFGQRAGETEAVQQPERERHHPGPSRGKTGLAPTSSHDLARQKENAERYGGLHGWTRHMNDAQSRQRERDRVRHGERGDRRDQHPQVRHDQDQREHEQQVVVAEQDVLDAVLQERTRDRE